MYPAVHHKYVISCITQIGFCIPLDTIRNVFFYDSTSLDMKSHEEAAFQIKEKVKDIS